MREFIAGSSARFHLKDGRPLVFHTVDRSFVRRRAGDILLIFIIGLLGFVAANLFARTHADARPASSTKVADSSR